MNDRSWTVETVDGHLVVNPLPDGRKELTVVQRDPDRFVHERTWSTSYPDDLIKLIAATCGVAGACFEIMREEDPAFVERLLVNDLSAYFPLASIQKLRILDFGCGTGASTAILARLFPTCEIVGLELDADNLDIAIKRAEYRRLENVTFLRSPCPRELPPDLGEFDLIVLSAVFEHLLPDERVRLLPALWHLLRPGGHLFLNQTPNQLFPFELHTTMLPLINYLPDSVALQVAHRFSRKTLRTDSWESLLRQGIRGATVREITGLLRDEDFGTELMSPKCSGLKDRVDLYYLNTNSEHHARVKTAARYLLKGLHGATGIALVPDLSLAYKKVPKG